MKSGNIEDHENQWREIRLTCHIRNFEVTEMLENYDNERLYYLNGSEVPLSLAESLKVRNHSPAGFNHGYGGSGPAQLALAICLWLYDRAVAEAVYQDFKSAYIATLPDQHKEFSVVLKVPVNPIAFWDLPFSLYEEDDYLNEGELLADEDDNEEERTKTENERLQQEHDQAYTVVIQLPGSIRYEFTGPNKVASFCYLRIVNNYQGKVLIIATDPGDRCEDSGHRGSGSSITNAAEEIAMQLCQEFDIPYEKLDWIERYVNAASINQYKNDHYWKFKETWDRVTFTELNRRLTNPNWMALQRVEIEQLMNIISKPD